MPQCCNCGKEGKEDIFDLQCCQCKGKLCENCIGWVYGSHSNYPLNTMKHKGSIIVFNNHGIGYRYCLPCYHGK